MALYVPFSAMSPNSEQLTCIVRLCLFRRLPHRTGRIYHHGTRNRNTSLITVITDDCRPLSGVSPSSCNGQRKFTLFCACVHRQVGKVFNEAGFVSCKVYFVAIVGHLMGCLFLVVVIGTGRALLVFWPSFLSSLAQKRYGLEYVRIFSFASFEKVLFYFKAIRSPI